MGESIKKGINTIINRLELKSILYLIMVIQNTEWNDHDAVTAKW